MKANAANVVRQKLKYLSDQLTLLRPEISADFETYQADKRRQLVTERVCQLCVEAAIDACEQLLEGLDVTAPETARDAISFSMELGAIEPMVADRFSVFVGFRNLLVHDYEKIKPRPAYDTARGILRHAPEFIASILRYLEKQEQQTETASKANKANQSVVKRSNAKNKKKK